MLPSLCSCCWGRIHYLNRCIQSENVGSHGEMSPTASYQSILCFPLLPPSAHKHRAENPGSFRVATFWIGSRRCCGVKKICLQENGQQNFNLWSRFRARLIKHRRLPKTRSLRQWSFPGSCPRGGAPPAPPTLGAQPGQQRPPGRAAARET